MREIETSGNMISPIERRARYKHLLVLVLAMKNQFEASEGLGAFSDFIDSNVPDLDDWVQDQSIEDENGATAKADAASKDSKR